MYRGYFCSDKMNAFFWGFVLAFLAVSLADEDYIRYDTNAIKRFDDELRRLGVSSPSLTIPEEPFDEPPPVVRAPAGKIEGYWTKSQFGRPIAAFEGIPYAAPPVGPLRFKVAQPAPPFTTLFKAKQPGERCVQPLEVTTSDVILGQEDCLFINVYAPEGTHRRPHEKLPVFVWVHGGVYIQGWGDVMKSNNLLDKDVIFVSFNYRVGPLGFFTTEDGTIPSNLGLKDQVAALQWINKNIASFGGDPNLVTAYGISGGASSTELLRVSPLTRGLVHRIISSSGSANSPWAVALPEETRKNRIEAAKFWGCPAEPSAELHACLQNKPAKEITEVILKFKKWSHAVPLPFKPVIEGDVAGAFLPDHPSNLYAENRVNDIPFIIGITSEDGTAFGSTAIFKNPKAVAEFDERFSELFPLTLSLPPPEENSEKAFTTLRNAYFGPGPFNSSQLMQAAHLFTDGAFLWPMIQSVVSHITSSKSPVYVYYFTYKGSRSFLSALGFGKDWDCGVSHGDDALYLFPFPGEQSPSDVRMTMIYSDLFTNFARDGVPSTKLLDVKWSPVTRDGESMPYLHINSPVDLREGYNLFPERWLLFKRLFGTPVEVDRPPRDEL